MAKPIISAQHTVKDGLLAASQSYASYKANRSSFKTGATFKLVGHTHVYFATKQVDLSTTEEMSKLSVALNNAFEAFEAQKDKEKPNSDAFKKAQTVFEAARKELETFCSKNDYKSYEAIETDLVTAAGTHALIPIKNVLIFGYKKAKKGQDIDVSDLETFDKGELADRFNATAEGDESKSLKEIVTSMIEELESEGKNSFEVSSARYELIYDTFNEKDTKKWIYKIDFAD